MNSYTSRLNTLGTHAATCLVVMAAVIMAATYVQTRPPADIKMELHSVRALRVSWRDRGDQAFLKITLFADLRPVMDWNVNGVYFSIVARYETDMHERNELVIWDRVITDREQAVINQTAEMAKYSLKSYSYDLRGRELEFVAKYVIMPYVGATEPYEFVQGRHTLPEAYTS